MEYSYRTLFLFLKKFLSPYWTKFVFSGMLSAISSIVALYNAFAFALVVSFVINYQSGESLDLLYNICSLWLFAIIIQNFCGFWGRYIGIKAAERAATDIELATVEHLARLDIAWHEKENSGSKMKRIQRGAKGVVVLVRTLLSGGISIIVNFIGIIFIIFSFDRGIAIALVIYQVIYYLIATFARRKGISSMKEANLRDEKVTGLFFEIVANIRSVKVLGMTKKVLEYSVPHIEDMLHWVNKRIFWFQGAGALQNVWEGIARIAFIAFIIKNIFDGNYQVSFLILFYGYFNTLTQSVSRLSEIAGDLAEVKVNVGRLIDILNQPVVIDREKGKVDFPKKWETLTIKNLSFNYEKNKVLTGIDLEIKKGEKIGIVGLSGAGKSTIFKLLLKEYENYKGSITIGKTPLKKIKKSSYVNHIAAVLQETEVFNMTLHQNVVLANSAESENRTLFERALDIAHINDFLPKLPLGAETIIGEKGVKLSGGEKQRLGIARAVFKNPEILFLDEATSHLDVESEQKIQDSLKKFFKGVTAVVIAHRLSTIREMDRIIVIEKGTIIESGTFDELHEKSGRFREFWDKQQK